MKKLLTLIVFAAATLCMHAQVDNEWMFNSPEAYLPSTTNVIVTRTSPCNQGEEAFMDFIPKFRTDKKFRDSRIKLAADDEIGNGIVSSADNWSLIKAGKGVNKREGYKYWGTWFDVSADNVCFKYSDEPTNHYSDWGGSSAFYRFQRIDGKWYLTGIVWCG